MKRIYLDNAATTPTDPRVVEAMLPYFTDNFGNPSGTYSVAHDAKFAVDDARKQLAKALNADLREIYFTSGGSESDNWALKGIAAKKNKCGKHIITSAIEHHAILHTCDFLKELGYDITILPVDRDGFISPDDLKAALRDDTILVSIMYANNEIGTIEPIKELAGTVKKFNPDIIFHTDAVQAFGNIPIDVKDLGVDLLSISGHKIYGPKGTGALFIKKHTEIENLIHGGAQEHLMRAGTENVPGIVGLGKAAELITQEMDKNTSHLIELRDNFIEKIEDKIRGVHLNGHRTRRLPGNVNFSFDNIEGESLLLNLDLAGICCSSGSACTSGSLDPSHVLTAIGLPDELAHGSVRMTLGHQTTMEDLDYVVDQIEKSTERLRKMSPTWNND